jgi:hypothetical protein
MGARAIPGPYAAEEMDAFLDAFLYDGEAFLVDEITRLDLDEHEIEGRLSSTRPLPYSDLQRTSPRHPAHVAAEDLIMVTGCLGFLHAWFFHGCRWNEGWVGFGNRIHRADFKRLVRRGPELQLCSRETRVRAGPRRVVVRYEFNFFQEDELVYFGDQTAIFLKDQPLE